MRRGWDWNFEEERRSTPAVPPGASQAHAPRAPDPSSRAAAVRRRRALLATGSVAAITLVILLVAAPWQRTTRAASTSRPRADPHGAPSAQKPEANPGAAVAATLAYTPFVREGGSRGHDVALTFDDGPGPYTPALLAVLEHYHVRGTFFAIGRMERYFSPSTVRELHDGDVVGDHTENHPMLALLSARDQHEELVEQMARIEILDGPRPVLFRPPYGSYSATTMRELRSLHLLMVLWSVDTGDYLQPGVRAIVERALAGAHPGAIILMHDGGGTRTETIEALPAIIRGLRARGLTPVTVPTLLRDDPPPAGQPLPENLSGD